jgi:type I restriction enzyme M protein
MTRSTREASVSIKRKVLEALGKDDIQRLVAEFDVQVQDRRVRDQLVDGLVAAKAVQLPVVLESLSRDSLKDVCRALGLDDGGRDKAGLVARILGGNGGGPAPQALAVPAPAAPAQARVFGSFGEMASFLWSIADLLRGTYKQADYGKVILPLTVMRRLDCVLADTKTKVLAKHDSLKGGDIKNLDPVLNRITGVPVHNVSKFDFEKLKGDPNHLAENLLNYIKGFSKDARDIFIERFRFIEQLQKLEGANLLFQVVSRFAEVDLHPNTVPNHSMGLVFEELIRRFAEVSNETAGEHFTPREVIRLMVDLLFIEDDDALRKQGIVRSLYDPACGTGGMLSVAEEYLRELNPEARLEVFGQELNDESYAICKADMMIKGQNPENIVAGNSFSQDGHVGKKFDYLLSNPPFGVEWKNVEKVIQDEHDTQGFAGRFGPGLPRISDGSTLFLLHMISKMKAPKDGGSRLAIVFNGSPLFSGDAGSGESEIRRWIIENDWLEAIVGLPDQLFYNTGISTYVWLVTNRKPEARKGKVQLINGVELFQKMRKSLGEKRKELSTQNIETLVELFGAGAAEERSKVFDNEDFGYHRITVERPLRLAFSVTPEKLEALKEETAFQNLAKPKKKTDVALGLALQARILEALATVKTPDPVKNREKFLDMVRDALAKANVDVPAPVMKAVVNAFGERDETADVCKDAKGNVEPDADLRDNENVPLKESIQAYFDREVMPHVPDAWVDEEKTKTGYEIPFTRHFYRYAQLRPLAEIEADIRALEAAVQASLAQVLI